MSGPTRIPRPRRALASVLLLAGIAVAAGALAPAASAAPTAVAAPRAAATPGTAAAAEAAPPAPKPGQVSWSALPSNAQGPDLRSKFVYNDIAAGSVIHDRVAIVNRSLASVSFSIYATDSTGTTSQNVLTWLKVGDKPKDIGRWEQFQLSKQVTPNLSVIIGGRQGIVLPFTIRVPSFDATPGDHTGAVMVQVGLPRQVSKNSSVIIYNRIAVPIELRVKGAYHTGLQVQSVSTSFGNSVNPFGNGSAIVSFTVVNTGNLRLTGSDLVKVTGPFGMSATAKVPHLPVILPGDAVRITTSAPGLYPVGPMSAHVSVSPGWARDEQAVGGMLLAQTQASASLFAVPWSLIGFLLLLAAAGAGVWYFLRWRRQQHVAEVTEAVRRARRETESRLATRQPVAAAVGTSTVGSTVGGTASSSTAGGDPASASSAASTAESAAPETGTTGAGGGDAAPAEAGNPAPSGDNGPDSGSSAEWAPAAPPAGP